MKRKNHTHSFLSVTIGLCVIFAFVFGAFLYGRTTGELSVASLKKTEDKVIKAEVETVVSLLADVYQKYLKGETTIDQAKEMGADLLRGLRYGEKGDGYFWVDTTDGVNVVLYGNKDIEGTNRWDAFVGGTYYVREIIRNGMKDGGGYTDYYYPKMGDTIPLPKRGYSLLYQPFNWVIGTGYYLEDIQAY